MLSKQPVECIAPGVTRFLRSVVVCVCIVAPHSLRIRWAFVDKHGMRLRLHAPKPCQNICGQYGNSHPGGDTGQGLFGARFAVRELVAANHDCDQNGDFGNRVPDAKAPESTTFRNLQIWES
jgi:hypothetical protein